MLEMFTYTFMIRAFIVGTLVSLCAAMLGVPLVLKRYSMIGDGLSHVGFGALAIAAALNVAPLKITIPIVIIAAFFLLRLTKNSKVKDFFYNISDFGYFLINMIGDLLIS